MRKNIPIELSLLAVHQVEATVFVCALSGMIFIAKAIQWSVNIRDVKHHGY